MIGWCEVCGKGPVPCAHIQSSMGDAVQCYVCTEGQFDPYGEMDDSEAVQRYRLEDAGHCEGAQCWSSDDYP